MNIKKVIVFLGQFGACIYAGSIRDIQFLSLEQGGQTPCIASPCHIEKISQIGLNMANDPVYWDLTGLYSKEIAKGTAIVPNMNNEHHAFWYAYAAKSGIVVEVLVKLIALDQEVAELPLRVQADIQELERSGQKDNAKTMFKLYTRIIPASNYMDTKNIAWIEKHQKLFVEPISQAKDNVSEAGATKEGNPILFLKNVVDIKTGYTTNLQLEVDLVQEIQMISGIGVIRR